MDENSKENVPLRDINSDDVNEEKETSQMENTNDPSEKAPLKGVGAVEPSTNHANSKEGEDTEKWHNLHMSKPKIKCIIILGVLLIIFLIVIICVTATLGSSRPEMIEGVSDNRLSMLKFFPTGNVTGSQYKHKNLIRFTTGTNGSWIPLVDNINKILSAQLKANPSLKSKFMSSICVKEKNFGYNIGQPCIFVQFNDINNWEPEIYTKEEVQSDRMDAKELPDEMGTSFNSNLVYVTCKGEDVFDRETVGPITYYPQSGYLVNYFPFTEGTSYPKPLIAIHLNKPSPRIAITIVCKIWAKNINHKDKNEVPKGHIQFSLIID